MKHYGRLIEHCVRNSALSISEIANDLNVSRSTIYHWFQKEKLASEIIRQLGNAIRHDFSVDFPELFTKEDFTLPTSMESNQPTPSLSVSHEENDIWKVKYLNLLEKHKALLEFYSQINYSSKAS